LVELFSRHDVTELQQKIYALDEEVSAHGASLKWYMNCEIHKELLMSLPLFPSVNSILLVEITLAHDGLSLYRKFVPHHVLRIFQYPKVCKNDHLLTTV
jgi:hypothetical protein